jgi:hypothetical protein
MKVFRAAAIVALMAGPAYAQSQSVPRYGDEGKPKTPQEIEADKAAERAYKNSLGNIPDQAPTDPWGNARSVNAPKVDAKADGTAASKSAAKTSPAKRTKTNITPN